MTHCVKLSDKTYNRLRELQGPRETYDMVIGRLIFIRDTIATVGDTLGPSHYLRERPPYESPVGASSNG